MIVEIESTFPFTLYSKFLDFIILFFLVMKVNGKLGQEDLKIPIKTSPLSDADKDSEEDKEG